jgi:hypothetical protein
MRIAAQRHQLPIMAQHVVARWQFETPIMPARNLNVRAMVDVELPPRQPLPLLPINYERSGLRLFSCRRPMASANAAIAISVFIAFFVVFRC